MDRITLLTDGDTVRIQVRPRHEAGPLLAIAAITLALSLVLPLPLLPLIFGALWLGLELPRYGCRLEEWIFDGDGVRRIRHYLGLPRPLQRGLPRQAVREAGVVERPRKQEVWRVLRVSGEGRGMDSYGRLALADMVSINLALDRQLPAPGYFPRGERVQA